MARTFVQGVKETRDGDSRLTWMLRSSSTAAATTAARDGGVGFKELLHNYGPIKREDLIQLLDKLEDVVAADLDDVVGTPPTRRRPVHPEPSPRCLATGPGVCNKSMQTENAAIRKDEEDGNKLEDGMNHSGQEVMGQKDNGALKRKNEEQDMAIQKRPHVESHDEVVFEPMDDTVAEEGFPNSGRDVFPLDWIDEPDVCTFCDDGVAEGDKLICCDGLCMRSFHVTKLSGAQTKCESLNLSPEVVERDGFVCANCKYKMHQCFVCGKLGSSDKSSQEVFVCGAHACRRFYHPDCVAKLLVAGPEHQDLASRIQQGLEKFSCPLHRCRSCMLEGVKHDKDWCLIKCRCCPVAWHNKCLPRQLRKQTWLVANTGNSFVMYCGKHKLHPVLKTPLDNHIIFPSASCPDGICCVQWSSFVRKYHPTWSPNFQTPGTFWEWKCNCTRAQKKTQVEEVSFKV
ncbi:hypothetical protein CY35_13G110100 [Sphagnum magellanicum]|nr:hypothetical protein CY35_13G110100 [Sphagnum magellanicum]